MNKNAEIHCCIFLFVAGLEDKAKMKTLVVAAKMK